MSGVPVEQVEEYQKYSGYFLIDIRVTFIMTYVYITVINLISTTANNEANQDTESPLLFNVTSRPEHTNVTVNSIDDATLWSCREHSPTSSYYVTLYWMLLATLSLTLLFYSVSKSFALWSINGLNSLNDIWHMAVMKHLRKPMKEASYSEDEAVSMAKCYTDLLSNKIPESIYIEMKRLPVIKIRKLIPYLSLSALVSAMVFGALSYDLHLVSCINGIPEDSINYNSATQTVELRFTDSVIVFQRISVFLTLVAVIFIILFAWWFYKATYKIVSIMEAKVENEINNEQKN